MARFQGFRCDVCSKSGDSSEKGGLPVGWMQVILPDTPNNPTPEDRSRDICCGRCLADLGKARGEVDGSVKPSKQSTKMDPALKAYLAEAGFTGQAGSAKMATHARYHADKVDDECPVCLFYQTDPTKQEVNA